MITEETYNKSFKNLFEKLNVSGKFLFQTKIELPFQIPVPDGYCVISDFDNRSEYWSILYFTSRNIENQVRIFDKSVPLNTKKTEVTLCVVGSEFKFDSFEKDGVERILSDEHTYFFDKSLDHLNAVILAYSVHFQDEYVYQITKFDLPPFCGYELINTTEWSVESILFVLHNNIDVNLNEITLKQCDALQNFSNHIISNEYMFLLPEKYLLLAKNKLNKGLYSEAVTFAQTAIEVKIKRLFYYFLNVEGLYEDEIIEVMENTTFMSMIKKELSKRLGGIWDITKEGSEIGNWYEKCYSLRNRVVHVGFIPELYETEQALKYAKIFAFYIIQLIEKKKKTYPELYNNIKIEL
ncbi:hypothetical protein [Algoriphagus terrigena]|uniref:hypothetical protein n=1 Tax=Algoriphagus terrigena TaxID=344884 RepID=UPI000401BF0C|nr:hypothetical protein [Algoriphagus terrigena]